MHRVGVGMTVREDNVRMLDLMAEFPRKSYILDWPIKRKDWDGQKRTDTGGRHYGQISPNLRCLTWRMNKKMHEQWLIPSVKHNWGVIVLGSFEGNKMADLLCLLSGRGLERKLSPDCATPCQILWTAKLCFYSGVWLLDFCVSWTLNSCCDFFISLIIYFISGDIILIPAFTLWLF